MFCKKCGERLRNDAQFCEKCGQAAEAADTVVKPAVSKMSLSKKTLALIGGGAVVVVALIAMLFGGAKKVDLNPYVTVSFSGYDGYGKATFDFDTKAFKEAYEGKLKFKNKKDLKEIQEFMGKDFDVDEYAAEFLLSTCVSGDLDKDSELRNGDVITFTWDCQDEDAREVLNCKLKYEDIQFTVEDLDAIETIDPFESINVTFSGIAPNGTVAVTNGASDKLVGNLYFEATPVNGLSNGDKVTVSLVTSLNENEFIKQCMEKYGKAPSVMTKEYEVEGLSTYVTSIEEIPKDTLDKMKGQAEDKLHADIAGSWDEGRTLDRVTYIGSYLLNKKPGAYTWGAENAIYLVYRIDAAEFSEEMGIEHKFHYYTTALYQDIVILEDGTCSVNLQDCYLETNRFTREVEWETWGYKYYGYEDMDTLFNDSVTVDIDNYTYESTVEDIEAASVEKTVQEEPEE